VDDVVVKTREEEGLISNLAETFDNLRKFKMKLNPEKCTFGVPSENLLGYMVSWHGIDPNPKKVSAITKIKPPESLHDVQKLSGCMAALSRFISSLSVRGLPFFKLLKKQEIPVEPGCTRGFRRLEEVFDYPTYSGSPRTPWKLAALHINYK
jgi:hypothetical protein